MYSTLRAEFSGSSMNSMNSSAVPGCCALAGIANASLPTGMPSLFFWNYSPRGS